MGALRADLQKNGPELPFRLGSASAKTREDYSRGGGAHRWLRRLPEKVIRRRCQCMTTILHSAWMSSLQISLDGFPPGARVRRPYSGEELALVKRFRADAGITAKTASVVIQNRG